MTVVALNGHELAETRDCRIPNCTRVATTSAKRGPWANLCDEHFEVEKERQRDLRAAAKPKARAGAAPPTEQFDSFERRARGLVKVGQRLDRAVVKLRPAKEEFEAATKAWREMCAEVGGLRIDE